MGFLQFEKSKLEISIAYFFGFRFLTFRVPELGNSCVDVL